MTLKCVPLQVLTLSLRMLTPPLAAVLSSSAPRNQWMCAAEVTCPVTTHVRFSTEPS